MLCTPPTSNPQPVAVEPTCVEDSGTTSNASKSQIVTRLILKEILELVDNEREEYFLKQQATLESLTCFNSKVVFSAEICSFHVYRKLLKNLIKRKQQRRSLNFLAP